MALHGWVAPTDFGWFEFLRARPHLDEVNFWFPKPRAPFTRLPPGSPVFFKLKAPHNRVAGWGVYTRFMALPLWQAWDLFGEKNGVPSFERLRRVIGDYRQRGTVAEPGDVIGCLMLTTPRFYPPEAWVPVPASYASNLVRGRSYDLQGAEGVALWQACMVDRAAVGLPAEQPLIVTPQTGKPQLVEPRLGQGTFRLLVTEAYDWACAVTNEHSLPVLEAAHIRPFKLGGPHDISNGLALRADIHRLFDRGYVTVTPDYHFEVSKRLESEYHNGKVYYAMHGRGIAAPAQLAHRPSKAQLAWHNEHVFRP